MTAIMKDDTQLFKQFQDNEGFKRWMTGLGDRRDSGSFGWYRRRKMPNTEIAIFISALSLAMAGLSLGWNIYRDIVLKPRVRVTAIIGPIIAAGVKGAGPTYICINAVNCGPGNTTLSLIILKKTSLFKWLARKQESGFVIPDYKNPASGKLPCELGVGERTSLLFPYDSECFLKDNMSHIGISDTFGRTHWMKTSQSLKKFLL